MVACLTSCMRKAGCQTVRQPCDGPWRWRQRCAPCTPPGSFTVALPPSTFFLPPTSQCAWRVSVTPRRHAYVGARSSLGVSYGPRLKSDASARTLLPRQSSWPRATRTRRTCTASGSCCGSYCTARFRMKESSQLFIKLELVEKCLL